MKLYKTLSLFGLLILSACHSTSEQDIQDDQEGSVLGQLEHGLTLNQGTQAKFDEGLLLLHNFEYDDAAVAFQEVVATDSTEILGHWGEAMCHYKALWRLQNTEKGTEILERLGSTKEERLAAIKDPMEKELWKLVEIMYGPGEFDERNDLIVSHMAALHEAYPHHQEIAAFYALSLIWATEEYGDGSEDLHLAASIADKITAVNPQHPGALHYKIHALDGPTSAQEAHDAADAYAKVAADAAHALHMPSHIYLALGEWEGVVNSNRASYDASVSRMKQLDLNDGARGYHSFAWLHYGLLQQGRFEEAEEVLKEMLELVPNDPTKGARGYLLGMQSRHLAVTDSLSDELKIDADIRVDDIGLSAKSVRSFLRAQLAKRDNKVQLINQEIKWLEDQISIAAEQVEGDGLAMCAAGTSRYAPTENSVRSAKVIVAQLEALKAQIQKDDARFEESLKAAVALESETNFPAGPPRITLPSFEQYGNWLIEQGRYNDAIAQYESSLKRMPRRSTALMGKYIALTQLKQMDEAKEIQQELENIFAEADQELFSVKTI